MVKLKSIKLFSFVHNFSFRDDWCDGWYVYVWDNNSTNDNVKVYYKKTA